MNYVHIPNQSLNFRTCYSVVPFYFHVWDALAMKEDSCLYDEYLLILGREVCGS